MLRREIKKIYDKRGIGNQRAIITEDASIISEGGYNHRTGNYEPWYEPVEIITPPLYIGEALKKLDNLLILLVNLEEAGLFRTNSSCGLHVNISERKLFRERYSAYNFTHKFIKTFDPIKWKLKFRRKSNMYCRMQKETLESFRKAKLGAFVNNRKSYGFHPLRNHYSAINTANIDRGRNSNTKRLEIRVAGNTGYHSNSARMQDYMKDVTDAMNKAAQAALKTV